MQRRPLLLTALVAGLAFPAAAAHATTYCVDDAACVKAGGTPQADLQTALVKAAGTPAADTVSVGKGAYLGQFSYTGSSPLTLQGAGAGPGAGHGSGDTLLTPLGPGAPTLALQPTGAATVTVSDLEVRSLDNWAVALRLDHGTAHNITVFSPVGAQATGVELHGATLRDSSVWMMGDFATGADLRGGGDLVDSSSIRAGRTIYNNAEGATTPNAVTRSRLQPAALGLFNVAGTLTANGDVIHETGEAIALDTVIGAANNQDTVIDARHITGVADPDQSTIVASANSDKVGRTSTIRLRDSILAGFRTSVIRSAKGGTANVTFDHTTPGAITDGGGPGAVTETSPLPGGDPHFVDWTHGDYHLAPGSPLIDAGSADPLAAGERITDLGGAPRLTDGDGDGVARRDPGAFESPAVAPPAPPAETQPAPGPAPVVAADRTAPVLSALRVAAKTRHVSFRLSEAATVKVVVQRRGAHGWRALRTGRKWHALAGANRFTLKLARGTYRLVLTPTDAAGNTGRPVSARLVRR